MGAPKGHENYNTSSDPIKNGGAFGYLGRGDDYYSEEILDELGKGLIEWISREENIWCKLYFSLKGIGVRTVYRLSERSPNFKSCLELAKEIQEGKLCSDPYFRKTDGNHARFMLARHHKGEWMDQQIVVATDEQKNALDGTLSMVDFLQKQKPAE